MNTRTTQVSAVVLSAFVTLAVLFGIDTLAVQEHAESEMAAASQPVQAAQMAVAKTPAPRS